MVTAPPLPLAEIVPSTMNPPLNITHITDNQGLDEVEFFFRHHSIFGLDIETNVVNRFFDRKIRLIQVGDKEQQFLIDLWELCGRDDDKLKATQGHRGKCSWWYKEGDFTKLYSVLVPVLDSRDWLKVGHNMEFEYETLSWCLGIYPWNLYCTYMAEKALWAGLVHFKSKGFWALDDLVARYFKVTLSKEEQKTFFTEECRPLTQRQQEYAALDIRFPLAIRQCQMIRLNNENLTKTAQIEFDAIPAFRDMKINGFFLDKEQWLALAAERKKEHNDIIRKLDDFFVPLVGKKHPPVTDEEMMALEEAWASLGIERPEEIELKQRIKQTRILGDDLELKDLWRAQRKGMEVIRKEKRKAARATMSEASKYRTWYKKEGIKMEGQAAINYGSPIQMLAILRKVSGVNKSNLPDTNDKTLKKLEKTFPICKTIMDYRETQKALGSYGEDYINFIAPETGKIHANFNQYEAETGRSSSDNPNLQQVPKDERYRSCFKAKLGWKLVKRDLEGCELRIMADQSGEMIWIGAFNRGEDIHETVAYNITKQIEGEVVWQGWGSPDCNFSTTRKTCSCPGHKKKRDQSKSINFGISYGLSVYGLMEQLNLSEQIASAIISAWKEANPTLAVALDRWAAESRMTGQARTPLGRRRLFDKPTFNAARVKLIQEWRRKKREGMPTNGDVTHKMKAILSSIGRQGCNHRLQGGNADLIKLAIGCGTDPNGKEYLWHMTRPDKDFAYLVNLVHDEVIYEVRDENTQKAETLIIDALERAGSEFVRSIKMTTDGNVSSEWKK